MNVSKLVGATWIAPGAIGSDTPNTARITTLTVDTTIDAKGTSNRFGDAAGNSFTTFGAPSPVGNGYALHKFITSNSVTNWALGCNVTASGAFEIIPSTAGGGSTFSTNVFKLISSGVLTLSGYGAGAATFSAAGVISSVSDETWKTKDGIPTDPDAMLKKLHPGYWYYNAEKAPIYGTDRQLGFYAQNVHDAIGPEAAPEPEEGKPWGYYDRSVLAVTVMSLQKALETIDSLIAKVVLLEAK